MQKRTSVLALAGGLSLLFGSICSGQVKVSYCTYFGDMVSAEILKGNFAKTPSTANFTSNSEAVECVDRIIGQTGLKRNFMVLRDDRQSNACALIQGDQRYILYNNGFMEMVKDMAQSNWSSISILAHEVGHHLNGHTLLAGGSRPDIELEADEFSGFVLYMLGASLEDAQAAMKSLASENDGPTHPGKFKRLRAIQDGWSRAARTYPRQRQPVPEEEPETEPDPAPAVYRARFTNTADVLSAAESRSAGGNSRRLHLFIEASQDEIDQIESVTYHLHPTFNNPNVTVVDPTDGFELTTTAWGTFQASATVRYKDGTTRELDHYITF